MGKLIKVDILSTQRISQIAVLHGEDIARKQIRSYLLLAEQMIGEILGVDQLVDCIRDEYHDLTSADLQRVVRKLLKMDIYGKPNSGHVMKAILAVEEEKSFDLEERHGRVKGEEGQPFHLTVMEKIKGIGKPHEVPWQQINLEDLLTLEDISGLSEQQKKQRQWVKEWFTERAAWAKSTGNKIEDYPITMETFVAQRWDELVKT